MGGQVADLGQNPKIMLTTQEMVAITLSALSEGCVFAALNHITPELQVLIGQRYLMGHKQR